MDGCTKQLPLTPTEAEKFKALDVGESMWIVREGDDCTCSSDGGTWAGGGGFPLSCPICHDADSVPPVEFVQACAPCETCDNGVLHKMSGDYPCGDCCIEMVGPCPNCPTVGKCAVCGSESIFTNGAVTLGYAYAVWDPLPIVTEVDELTLPCIWLMPNGRLAIRSPGAYEDITDTLAHCGPPESLDGQWAIEVRKA